MKTAATIALSLLLTGCVTAQQQQDEADATEIRWATKRLTMLDYWSATPGYLDQGDHDCLQHFIDESATTQAQFARSVNYAWGVCILSGNTDNTMTNQIMAQTMRSLGPTPTARIIVRRERP